MSNRWTLGPFPKVGKPADGVSWVEDGKQGQALLFLKPPMSNPGRKKGQAVGACWKGRGH